MARPLTKRIIDFFAATPGEELSYDDMAQKFGCTRSQACEAVALLRESGRISVQRAVVFRIRVVLPVNIESQP
jgi:DNA-binding GntR family transcriptional regulator